MRIVDLPENYLANRPFLPVAASFKNCSQNFEQWPQRLNIPDCKGATTLLWRVRLKETRVASRAPVTALSPEVQCHSWRKIRRKCCFFVHCFHRSQNLQWNKVSKNKEKMNNPSRQMILIIDRQVASCLQ